MSTSEAKKVFNDDLSRILFVRLSQILLSNRRFKAILYMLLQLEGSIIILEAAFKFFWNSFSKTIRVPYTVKTMYLLIL